MKDCYPWEGPTLEQVKSMRRKEQQRGAVRVTAAIIPHPSTPLGGGKVEESGTKKQT